MGAVQRQVRPAAGVARGADGKHDRVHRVRVCEFAVAVVPEPDHSGCRRRDGECDSGVRGGRGRAEGSREGAWVVERGDQCGRGDRAGDSDSAGASWAKRTGIDGGRVLRAEHDLREPLPG